VPIVSPLDSFIIYGGNWTHIAHQEGFDYSDHNPFNDEQASLTVSFYGTAIFLETTADMDVSLLAKERGIKADRCYQPTDKVLNYVG
jgi:hypothetical protein